jgi:hypothetical protein
VGAHVQEIGPKLIASTTRPWSTSSRSGTGETDSIATEGVHLALELGRELEVLLPTTAVTNVTAANGMFTGGKDSTVIFNVFATMSGVETEVLV